MSQPALRPFVFLDLPADIRAQIYGFTFCEAVLYVVDGEVDEVNSSGPGQILRTCSDIYREALGELYRSITLVYVQDRKSLGPLDNPLPARFRKLIRWMVLKRKCHWTHFSPMNWAMLRKFEGLKKLVLEDDSYFCYSRAQNPWDLYTDITRLRTPNGPDDDSLVRMLMRTIHDRRSQPRAIIRPWSWDLIADRVHLDPPRTFAVEYWKTGSLVDRHNNSIFMTLALDVDSWTIVDRRVSHKPAHSIVMYWYDRMVSPENAISHGRGLL